MMTMKIQKPLAIIAAVVMTLLLAVSTAIPAFAAETDMTAQSDEKFDVVEPEYNGDANDYVTLPEAPKRKDISSKAGAWTGAQSFMTQEKQSPTVTDIKYKLNLCIKQLGQYMKIRLLNVSTILYLAY